MKKKKKSKKSFILIRVKYYIMKIFIPVIIFYGNKNVCLGFVRWFLYTLLLLKIVSMTRCYVYVWGIG